MGDQLSKLSAVYVHAINSGDQKAFIELFAEDAIVNDAGREIRGRAAIQTWAASDIFAANVSFDVLDASGDEVDATITAKVDGTFDRTGLPDPLIMTFQIISRGGVITSLTCQLAGSARS